jgi:hypothetical protein
MLGSLLDVVRFLEKIRVPHSVPGNRPVVLFTFNGVQLVLRWDLTLRRAFCCRLDEERLAAVQQTSVGFDDAGRISQGALVSLLTTAMRGPGAALMAPLG